MLIFGSNGVIAHWVAGVSHELPLQGAASRAQAALIMEPLKTDLRSPPPHLNHTPAVETLWISSLLGRDHHRLLGISNHCAWLLLDAHCNPTKHCSLLSPPPTRDGVGATIPRSYRASAPAAQWQMCLLPILT